MVKALAAIGAIALLLLGVGGCSQYYQGKMEQAKAVGHAQGFVEGLSLGLSIPREQPKATRL